MDASTALAIAISMAGGLGIVVWWVIRHTHAKVEEESEKREVAVENVRRNLQAHELHVAREYVNHDRLAQALRPLEAGVARVEGTLERLFGKLDGKQDKP